MFKGSYGEFMSETEQTKAMKEHSEPSKEETKKEYILCAAIHWDDGETYPHQPKNITTGLVICGRRHHNILAVKSRVGCSAFSNCKR